MTSGIDQIVALVDAAVQVRPPLIARESGIDGGKKQSGKPGGDGDGEKHSPADAAAPAICADGMTEDSSSADSSRAPKIGAASADDRSPSADDAGEKEPRTFGFSVEQLNREFALVLMGSKAVVFLEQPKAPIEDQKRVLSLDALKAWFANRFTERRGADGRVKAVTWATAWLQSRERRSYRGIEFHPDTENAGGTPGYLNLWSGFAVAPATEPDARRYMTFRDHLLNNICDGDADLFKWVFAFFAHIVQRPRERVGVALVLRGGMGTGKTKVGEVFGRLFPRHFFLVDDPRYVTGQFNAHMASCLLLQADEAVWAGDPAALGRLKGLITSSIQQIEAKGVDPIRLPNYVRLMFTSNEDWVVPAGKDERRFAVFDVNPRCARNTGYFRQIDDELDAGGLAHLLADLLAFPLDSIDLRRIPKTEALLEQKIRSLDSIETWWFARLRAGAPTRRSSEWSQQVAVDQLFSDYLASSDRIGVRRKQDETVFGMKLTKLLGPELRRQRKWIEYHDESGGLISRRAYCYLLPDLVVAREKFATSVNQPITWPLDDEGASDSHAPNKQDDDIVKI